MIDVLSKEQREEIQREASRCIWFTPREALTWALAAYYGACKDALPPKGEPWRVEGAEWTSPGDFAEAFHRRLTRRLNWEAREHRLAPPGSSSELLGWEPPEADCDALQRDNLPPCSGEDATLDTEEVASCE